MAENDTTLARLAGAQHGLVTRAEALEVLTRRQLERRVADGRMERLLPCVYRVVGAPETWEQRVVAACLAGGPRTYASFRTAARLWALAGFEHEDRIEITTPSRRRVRVAEIVVHDSEVGGRRHATIRHGVPVSTPARTLCDLTACSEPRVVERAVDDALRRKLVTLKMLRTVYLDLAGPGRRRCTVMRDILRARGPGFDPGDSPREIDVIGWLVAGGLPRPIQQHRVRLGRRSVSIDLAYPDLLIGIEYDGWDAHRTRSAFDSDRVRQNELEVRGWLILRFTSASSPADVVRTVRAAIAARSERK